MYDMIENHEIFFLSIIYPITNVTTSVGNCNKIGLILCTIFIGLFERKVLLIKYQV